MQRAGSGIGVSVKVTHRTSYQSSKRQGAIDRRLKLIRQREFEMKRKENALIEAERQLQQSSWR